MSDTSLIFSIFAVDKVSPTLSKIGGKWGKLSASVLVAEAAIAAKTVGMAGNFQTSMNKLSTSAGEARSNIGMVGDGVLKMASEVGDTPQQLANALYTVESGGQHGAAALTVLRAAAEGAKAEQADLTTVSDAVTSALQDYHLTAGDAATVTSKLVAATGAGKMTFEQLAGSLHSVLPAASAAGISLDDILAAEASMTVHGMSADQATQNLADTINHMQKPTQVQSKELAQLGINAADLSGMLGTKGVGLTGTIQFISQTILSKMGPAGKVLLGTFTTSQQAGKDLKQMISGMPPSLQKLANSFLAGKINSQDWKSALQGLTPIQAGQMGQFATLAKRANGFSDALKSGSPAAQSYSAALASAMGDSTGLNTALMLTRENSGYVTTALNAVSSATTEAGNHVKGWSDIQGTFNQKESQAKAAVQVLGIQIGNVLLPAVTALTAKLVPAVSWLAQHHDALVAVGVVAGTAATIIATYKVGVFAVQTAQKAATIATVAWKVAVVATNIVVNSGRIAAYAFNAVIWQNVTAMAASTGSWIKSSAAVAWNTTCLVAQKVALVATSVATKAATAAQWLLNVAMDANPIGIIIIVIVALVAIFVVLWLKCAWFRDFWIGMWDVVKGIGLAVGHWFAGPFAHFFVAGWDAVKHAFNVAVNWVSGKIVGLINFFSGLGGKIGHAVKGAFDGVKNAFKSAVNWIIDKWNNLSFSLSIPKSIMGIPIPGGGSGFTLNTPNIPRLYSGGMIMKSGVARVGEKGVEDVLLPAGARVLPHGSGGGNRPIQICIHVHGRHIRDLISDIGAEVRGSFGGNVQVALGGH